MDGTSGDRGVAHAHDPDRRGLGKGTPSGALPERARRRLRALCLRDALLRRTPVARRRYSSRRRGPLPCHELLREPTEESVEDSIGSTETSWGDTVSANRAAGVFKSG